MADNRTFDVRGEGGDMLEGVLRHYGANRAAFGLRPSWQMYGK